MDDKEFDDLIEKFKKPHLKLALEEIKSGNHPQINLRENGIGDEEAKAIAEVLPLGCAGLKLNLAFNEIGNIGAEAFIDALESGKCPPELAIDLTYNNIEVEILNKISRLVGENNSYHEALNQSASIIFEFFISTQNFLPIELKYSIGLLCLQKILQSYNLTITEKFIHMAQLRLEKMAGAASLLAEFPKEPFSNHSNGYRSRFFHNQKKLHSDKILNYSDDVQKIKINSLFNTGGNSHDDR